MYRSTRCDKKCKKKRVQKPKLGPAKRARKRVRGAFQGRRTSRFAGNNILYKYMYEWYIHYSLIHYIDSTFFCAKCHFSPCSWAVKAKTGVCVRVLGFQGFQGWIGSIWRCGMNLWFLPSRIGRCSGKSLSIWLPSQQTEPRLSQPAFSSKWPWLHIGNWICESTLAGSTV